MIGVACGPYYDPLPGVDYGVKKQMISHLTFEHLSLTRDCAEEFFRESQLPGFLMFKYWMQRWKQLLELGLGTIIAYHEGENIKGILGGVCAACMMTGDMEASEMFWFVRQPYRNGPAGIKLLQEFEKWASLKGARRIKMVHLESINADKLEEIYGRLGYVQIQRAYSKEL